MSSILLSVDEGSGGVLCKIAETKEKSRFDFLFVNKEQNLLKNRYIFHLGLKYFSKVSCHRPTAVPLGGGGGGEVVLNKSLYVIDIHRTV